MGASRQSILRTPIILLAVADLAVLGARLWPWQNVMSLPGNGTTGIDPVIALAGYIGLGFWINTAREDSSRKSLFSAALLGMVAGLFLVFAVVVATRQNAPAAAGPDRLQMILLGGAVLFFGIVGLRTAKAGHPAGFSAVCAIWASMVACLMAVATVLGETYLSAGTGESSDPWRDYQGLAIGTPAMQALVNSLQLISGFLLIGPIVGCIAGTVFASFGKAKKA